MVDWKDLTVTAQRNYNAGERPKSMEMPEKSGFFAIARAEGHSSA
jgi:hypothetical protein